MYGGLCSGNRQLQGMDKMFGFACMACIHMLVVRSVKT